MSRTDVVVVGAGMVGACCALALADRGIAVTVVERGSLAGGSTAAGEGNLLVSDKEGAELQLATLSLHGWQALAERVDDDIELEAKGGLVVATTDEGWSPLRRLAERQRAAGVDARELTPHEARQLEPELTDDLRGAVSYPQDQQVQPVRAVAAALRLARGLGASVRFGTAVTAIERDRRGAVRAVVTSAGRIRTAVVVNAAGAHSAEVAALAGLELPVRPRRGHILVTAPTRVAVRHKVYDADYVGTITEDTRAPQVSSVVESTRSGPVLIGSSREFIGFEREPSMPVLAAIARRALSLFPGLAAVPIIRAYVGFRPWSPDHLPIIGPDDRAPGLFHATGHEGAGICLAPATGLLLSALIAGDEPPIDGAPFDPSRPALQAPDAWDI